MPFSQFMLKIDISGINLQALLFTLHIHTFMHLYCLFYENVIAEVYVKQKR